MALVDLTQPLHELANDATLPDRTDVILNDIPELVIVNKIAAAARVELLDENKKLLPEPVKYLTNAGFAVKSASGGKYSITTRKGKVVFG